MCTPENKCYHCTFALIFKNELHHVWNFALKFQKQVLKTRCRSCLSLIALKMTGLYLYLLNLFLHMPMNKVVFHLMWILNVDSFNKQHMRHDCENFFYICRRDRTPSSCLLCLGCRDLQLSLLFGRNEATPKERFFFFLIADFLVSFLLQLIIPFFYKIVFKEEIAFEKIFVNYMSQPLLPCQ